MKTLEWHCVQVACTSAAGRGGIRRWASSLALHAALWGSHSHHDHRDRKQHQMERTLITYVLKNGCRLLRDRERQDRYICQDECILLQRWQRWKILTCTTSKNINATVPCLLPLSYFLFLIRQEQAADYLNTLPYRTHDCIMRARLQEPLTRDAWEIQNCILHPLCAFKSSFLFSFQFHDLMVVL